MILAAADMSRSHSQALRAATMPKSDAKPFEMKADELQDWPLPIRPRAVRLRAVVA